MVKKNGAIPQLPHHVSVLDLNAEIRRENTQVPQLGTVNFTHFFQHATTTIQTLCVPAQLNPGPGTFSQESWNI
jgi:hypothetical protein